MKIMVRMAKKVDKRAGNKVVADKNIELLCKELF